MIGLYVPGTSALHRCPAGRKLVVLLVVLLAVGLWRTPVSVATAAVVALVLAAASGLPAVVWWRHVRPVLAFVVPAGALQWWWDGPAAAGLACTWVLTGVLLASLVTLTTPMTELLDVLVRGVTPLRRLGVDPDRVALVLTLAIRSVPVLQGLALEVVDARRARGVGRSLRAFAVPFVIRSARHAHRLGEALTARGVDD